MIKIYNFSEAKMNLCFEGPCFENGQYECGSDFSQKTTTMKRLMGTDRKYFTKSLQCTESHCIKALKIWTFWWCNVTLLLLCKNVKDLMATKAGFLACCFHFLAKYKYSTMKIIIFCLLYMKNYPCSEMLLKKRAGQI